jgi:lysozyme
MELDQAGIDFICQEEGCKLTAYQDQGGVWTIGVGHTGQVDGQDICEGMTITQDQANALLQADAQTAVDGVNNMLQVTVSQNQFNALVDFAFNEGVGALKGSTLMRLLNQGDFDGAVAQFSRWDMDAGQVNQGLLNRRNAEAALFQS